jgi:hypothetical protein
VLQDKKLPSGLINPTDIQSCRRITTTAGTPFLYSQQEANTEEKWRILLCVDSSMNWRFRQHIPNYTTSKTKLTKIRGLSPRENYSDRRFLTKTVPTSADRERCVVSATGPQSYILGFLARSRYFFFQAAPQLYSRGWVDPVPDPTLLRKSGSAGNRTWTSGSVTRNSDHYTTGAVTRWYHFKENNINFDCRYRLGYSAV